MGKMTPFLYTSYWVALSTKKVLGVKKLLYEPSTGLYSAYALTRVRAT